MYAESVYYYFLTEKRKSWVEFEWKIQDDNEVSINKLLKKKEMILRLYIEARWAVSQLEGIDLNKIFIISNLQVLISECEVKV